MAIINNPFDLLEEAFRNLYPDKKYLAQFEPELHDESGNSVYGSTVFPYDGTEPLISICGDMKVLDAVEVFCHELAHVAAGMSHEHDYVFMVEYDRIFCEYERICNKRFGESGEE